MSADEVAEKADFLPNSNYGQYLKSLLESDTY
jgi:hypothetical protein